MALQDISLRWKLLGSFLLLSFLGTTALVWIAFRSQQALILTAERASLEGHYHRLLQSMDGKRDQALSLAWAISLDPHIQDFFARKDRRALLEHVEPMYRMLSERFGVRQLHFHLPPATSFLRVHRPEQYGERMEGYRRTILHVVETGESVGGLERGATGYGIRGVVPVRRSGEFLGTVEVGFSFGKPFVEEFKENCDCDLTIYVRGDGGAEPLSVLASSLKDPRPVLFSGFREVEDRDGPLLWMPLPETAHMSGLLGAVKDFSGQATALAEIRIDRRAVQSLLRKYRWEMILVEALALLAAVLVVWMLVHRFLRPIQEMVGGASQIAAGQRLHMPVRGRDEMSQLARALNSMVGYLEASRERTREYAQNLEREVQKRTRELRASEEKHRTLLERLPLVVYQMNPERTLTFVSPFTRELLNAAPSELVEIPGALDRLVHPEDRERVQRGFRAAVAAAAEWVQEYRLQTVQGRIVHVQDHAIPILDEAGVVVGLDGILVDATGRKKLQEMSLQAEELKTLGEISARLAHEIRNPLTTIGGLARRIPKELPEDHPTVPWFRIILQEVQRLESILHTVLSYIRPMDVHLSPCDLEGVLSPLFSRMAPEFDLHQRRLAWTIEPGLPPVALDRDLFPRALATLSRHILFRMDPGTESQVRVEREEDRVRIRWTYQSSTLAVDDLSHYFYPFLAQGMEGSSVLDLPVAKIALHKHGGLVHVGRQKDRSILLQVTLPLAEDMTGARPPEVR